MISHLIRLLIVTLLCSPIMASGADFILVSDAGTSAGTIGKAGIEGFSDGAHTIFENPAGLSRIPNQSLSLFSANVMHEVSYTNAAFASMTPYGMVGIGFMNASVYDIPETGLDSQNRHIIINHFDYLSSIYKASYQTNLATDLSVGIGLSYYTVQFFDVVGTGSNFDVGALYTRNSSEFSLTAKNALPNSKIRYNDGHFENLPFQMVGSMKQDIKDVQLLAQLTLRQEHLLYAFGGEYYPSFLPFISLRTGFKQHLTVTKKRRQNGSFGVGLHLYGLNFHYAYERSDYIPMDNTSYFSMSTAF